MGPETKLVGQNLFLGGFQLDLRSESTTQENILSNMKHNKLSSTQLDHFP